MKLESIFQYRMDDYIRNMCNCLEIELTRAEYGETELAVKYSFKNLSLLIWIYDNGANILDYGRDERFELADFGDIFVLEDAFKKSCRAILATPRSM